MQADRTNQGDTQKQSASGGAPTGQAAGLRALGRSALWPVLLAFQVGIIFALLPQTIRRPEPSAEPQAHAQVNTVKPHPTIRAIDLSTELTRADHLMLQLCSSEALLIYEQLRSNFNRPPEWLQFRVALALELDGRLDDAVKLLQYTAHNCRQLHYYGACRIAEARVWLKLNQPHRAIKILSEIVLNLAQNKLVPPMMRADALHLLGVAVARTLQPKYDDMLKPDSVANPQIVLNLTRDLEWAKPAQESEESSPPSDSSPGDTLEVRKMGPGPLQFAVSSRFSNKTVSHVLQQLGRAADLQLKLSPKAQQRCDHQVVTVHVRDMPLTHFLFALSQFAEFVLLTDGNIISLAAASDLAPAKVRQLRLKQTRDFLRDVTLSSPGHYLSHVSYIEAANLELELGRLKQAVNSLEQFERLYKVRDNRDVTYFNLAKALLASGEIEEATEYFYRVIDDNPASELAIPAYVLAGAALLEQGKLDRAPFPLRRALALSTHPRYTAYAAAKLALVYLIKDNPLAAGQVLQEHREYISNSEVETYCAFLGAYATFLGTPPPLLLPKHRSRLLSSLIQLEAAQLRLGTPERVLVTEAYERLGLSEKAAAYALPAVKKHLPAVYLARLVPPLVRHYRQVGDLPAAWSMLQETSAQLEGPVRTRLLLELARIAYEAQRWNDSIAICLDLMTSTDAKTAKEALLLLGKTFEQLGNYRLAALCYAGRVNELRKLIQNMDLSALTRPNGGTGSATEAEKRFGSKRANNILAGTKDQGPK